MEVWQQFAQKVHRMVLDLQKDPSVDEMTVCSSRWQCALAGFSYEHLT